MAGFGIAEMRRLPGRPSAGHRNTGRVGPPALDGGPSDAGLALADLLDPRTNPEYVDYGNRIAESITSEPEG